MNQEKSYEYYLSTEKILNNVFEIFKRIYPPNTSGHHLDIGAGEGTLIKLINNYNPAFCSSCVDYTEQLIQDKNIKIDIIDLNVDKLPYEDNHFDFITCTEVIEHLENYRRIVREAYRVAKPNGFVVFSTPNILNLNSRIRYLWTGFQNLFGPLNIGRDMLFSTEGHITPVSYFFLAHALAESGFRHIDYEIDKKQSSAYPLLFIFYPLILIFGKKAFSREKRKGFINKSNAHMIAPINSMKMLLGRTIIVLAQK